MSKAKLALHRQPNEFHNAFYSIQPNGDGTVDVYLIPEGRIYRTSSGTEIDAVLLAVRGIVPFPGMEWDIRRRYGDWCAAAEKIDI